MKHIIFRISLLLAMFLLLINSGYTQLNISTAITNSSCYLSTDGSIDLTVTGGVTPYTYLWSNSATIQDLTDLAPGSYTVTITDSYNPVPNAFNWSFFNSGAYWCDNFLIQAGTVLINGLPASTGDYIGVFYTTSTGGFGCGGYNTAVPAFRDYPDTPFKDGFINNEPINWKVWHITNGSNGIVVNMTASYAPLNPPAITNQGYFIENTIGVLNSLTGYYSMLPDTITGTYNVTHPDELIVNVLVQNSGCTSCDNGSAFLDISGGTTPYTMLWSTGETSGSVTGLLPGTYNVTVTDNHNCTVIEEYTVDTAEQQQINIPQGWSIFSTFINPSLPGVNYIFAQIVSQVSIVKDGLGNPYWPAYNVNNIGDMQIGKGYQVRMLTAQFLTITGHAIVPETNPINIPSGWSILGYLRQSPALVVTMMSQIVSALSIMKDGDGNVYWPQYGVNNIVNMQPGKGYQIKVASTCTLTYPPN
ncbi:MAG: SprB repeat-containing protein [Bacteroidia bacterium]|nr:SprB repeat-containing protein [Bacteroidia bacterium]